MVEQPKTSLNTSACDDYGDIEYIFENFDVRASIFKVNEYMDDVIKYARNKGFNPAKDYFAFAGSLIPVTNAVIALLTEFGTIRVLLYTSVEHRYIEVIYTLEDDDNEHHTGKSVQASKESA